MTYGDLQAHENEANERDLIEQRAARAREHGDDVRLERIWRIWRRERDWLILQAWGEGP